MCKCRPEEPTNWRPWSWHEGDPTIIEFRDGTKHEIDGFEGDPGAEWEERLWKEIEAELESKGIEAHPTTDCYPPGAQEALRWRPISELPEWAWPKELLPESCLGHEDLSPLIREPQADASALDLPLPMNTGGTVAASTVERGETRPQADSDRQPTWPLGHEVPRGLNVVAYAACGEEPDPPRWNPRLLPADRRRAVEARRDDLYHLASLGPECKRLFHQVALWLVYGAEFPGSRQPGGPGVIEFRYAVLADRGHETTYSSAEWPWPEGADDYHEFGDICVDLPPAGWRLPGWTSA